MQEVSYRASTASEARRIGVVGWVRNLDDGSVELEAEGDDAKVAALLSWCENGPPMARVTNVAVEEQTPKRTETAFAIER